MIVPLMLVMFFGTVEFSSGVAVDRKVTLVARTLSDLTSQSTSVDGYRYCRISSRQAPAILTPYSATPTKSTITELYVDPTTLQGARCNGARRRPSDASGSAVLGTSSHSQADIVTIPDGAAGRTEPI